MSWSAQRKRNCVWLLFYWRKKRMIGGDSLESICRPSVITWVDFKDVFNKSYYPLAYKDDKQDLFLHLVQGSVIVVEYQKRFMELSKYAALLIANEVNRCKRFEGGLRREIRVAVIGGDHKHFGKLVETALRRSQRADDS
ncbi:Gag protease polyprotein-like protein [Abeliophyllum distichum]|uniref:Gag protease polyprotein-like protein n=1 Tax=Abeliophyllum distichum TaxID=126358 RepID=A0ABD1QZM9_9LAMI